MIYPRKKEPDPRWWARFLVELLREVLPWFQWPWL